MVDYENIRHIYFIGIGGIGMSALARYFHARGKNVSGYDRSSSEVVTNLQELGIQVINSDAVSDLPPEIQDDKETLIVYTPAIPEDHRQYRHFAADSYQMEKRAVVLGHLLRDRFTLAVAGTHGKTTTSTLLAHLLKASGMGITAFLGGISENYQSNLLLDGEEAFVVEADEFDRSFLQLNPNIAAITSMDADHLDIYGGTEQFKESFRAFAARVPADGQLFITQGLPLKGTTVGLGNDAEIAAQDIEVHQGCYHFSLRSGEKIYPGFRFNLPGRHNLQNAVTALAMAMACGVSVEILPEALESFRGVRRRFSYRIRREDLVLIDDYAHHPAEITGVHQAIREMHPGKEVLAVFQPHLYSRTRDFGADFARSLELFDQVVLLDIYPAREAPIEGITSQWLLHQIENPRKELVQNAALPAVIKESSASVVVMMGAGNIGEEVGKVTKELTGEN